MDLIQILVIVFALFSYSRVILRYKDTKVTLGELLFWTFIWVAIILVAINPGFLGWLTAISGTERPLDALLYLSVVVMFYLIFRIYVKLRNIDQDITKIVRKVAQNESPKKTKK